MDPVSSVWLHEGFFAGLTATSGVILTLFKGHMLSSYFDYKQEVE